MSAKSNQGSGNKPKQQNEMLEEKETGLEESSTRPKLSSFSGKPASPEQNLKDYFELMKSMDEDSIFKPGDNQEKFLEMVRLMRGPDEELTLRLLMDLGMAQFSSK